MTSRTSSRRRRVFPFKKPEINWDVLGFMSAAITLLSTGFLYLIGWAYISNWYGYFGMNTLQLNVSVPEVLIRSISPLAVALSAIIISIPIYYGLSRVSFFIQERQWWFIAGLSLLLTFLVSCAYFPAQINGLFAGLLRYLVIPAVIIFGTIGFGTFLYQVFKTILHCIQIRRAAFNTAIYLIVIFLLVLYFSGDPGIASAVLISILAVLLWFPNTVSYLGLVLKSLRGVVDVPSLLKAFSFGELHLNVRILILGLLYLTIVLFLSMSMAFHSASGGKMGVWEINTIQKVYLISPTSLSFMSDLETSCDETGRYVYGPLGLVAEDEGSFFFVKWNENLPNGSKFAQNPGIFVVPRSEPIGAFSIAPASISITPRDARCVTTTVAPSIASLTPTTQPSATLTITSTQTAVADPPTPTATFVPQPSLTPPYD